VPRHHRDAERRVRRSHTGSVQRRPEKMPLCKIKSRSPWAHTLHCKKHRVFFWFFCCGGFPPTPIPSSCYCQNVLKIRGSPERAVRQGSFRAGTSGAPQLAPEKGRLLGYARPQPPTPCEIRVQRAVCSWGERTKHRELSINREINISFFKKKVSLIVFPQTLKGAASAEGGSVNDSGKLLSPKAPRIFRAAPHAPRAALSEENIGRKDTFKSIFSLMNSAE